MAGFTGSIRKGRRGAVHFDVSQLKLIDTFLEKLKKAGVKAIQEALEEEADKILAMAQTLTPVDTGRLKESGRVIKPRRDATKTKFEYVIIFGGIQVRGLFIDYALEVHERTDVPHRVGQAKYLSTAFRMALPGLAKRIEARLDLEGNFR